MENGLPWRLSSFFPWPSTISISPVTLANAGFKYTGCGDKVECPICRLQIEGWESNGLLNPRAEHVTRSPRCWLALECLQPDTSPLSAAERNTVTSALSSSQIGHQLQDDSPSVSSSVTDGRIDDVTGPNFSPTSPEQLGTYNLMRLQKMKARKVLRIESIYVHPVTF